MSRLLFYAVFCFLFQGSHRRRDFYAEHQETLDHKVCDGVQTFLMFIGYPRSGHTLISSLLDAHPNAIVANEFEVIGKWQKWETANKNKYFLFDQLYQNSKQEAEIGYRSATVPHRYNYSVPGQWQGTFNERILVSLLMVLYLCLVQTAGPSSRLGILCHVLGLDTLLSQPANLMLGGTLRGTSIPSKGGVEIFLAASCYRNRDKAGLVGPLAHKQTFNSEVPVLTG